MSDPMGWQNNKRPKGKNLRHIIESTVWSGGMDTNQKHERQEPCNEDVLEKVQIKLMDRIRNESIQEIIYVGTSVNKTVKENKQFLWYGHMRRSDTMKSLGVETTVKKKWGKLKKSWNATSERSCAKKTVKTVVIGECGNWDAYSSSYYGIFTII